METPCSRGKLENRGLGRPKVPSEWRTTIIAAAMKRSDVNGVSWEGLSGGWVTAQGCFGNGVAGGVSVLGTWDRFDSIQRGRREKRRNAHGRSNPCERIVAVA